MFGLRSIVKTLGVLNASILALLIGCAENQSVVHPPPLATLSPELPVASQEPTDAKGILLRMADYLANTQKFTVLISDNYDTVQEAGQKIEFSEKRKITLSRPNGLRVELEESSGEKHVLTYDGKVMTVFNPYQNVYAQIDKSGGIDEAVVHLVKDLRMRLPLAMLLISRFPTEIENRTQTLDYVEKTAIHGVSCHHLVGATESVDYQVWIREGDQPLPLRIVLTYKYADGQPQFRAQFSEWNLTQVVNDAEFTFTPPVGSTKIAFAAQLSSFVSSITASSVQPGEQP